MDHKKIPKPVYEAFKNTDDLTKIVKTGGKAIVVAGVVLDVYELENTVYADLNDEDQKLVKKMVSTAAGITGSWAGGAAGAKLGAIAFSAIGTLICPGLGTAIGGFVGSIAGGIFGTLGGRALGEYIVDETYQGE